jgi:uncharacterized protein YodC (DUF2158 family)
VSYDLAVVAGPIADQDAIAWQGLDALLAMQGEPAAILRKFHDRLIERYPCLSTFSDEELDSDKAVWSDGSLLSNFGPHAAHLVIQYPRADVVVPFVIETARPFGLNVFDWWTRQIHRPDGLAGLVLTLEERPPLTSPTLMQIEDAVDSLTPAGGPGFMDVTGADRDYVQVAGGDGMFSCEWRTYDGAGFRHWVAGRTGAISTSDVQIPTNGFHVTVKQHERLSATDVKAVLRAFSTSAGRPTAYAWRDITKTFQ